MKQTTVYVDEDLRAKANKRLARETNFQETSVNLTKMLNDKLKEYAEGK